MKRELLINRYHEIRQLMHDPDEWLETPFGSDLWVDGLNVFLTIEPEDFQEVLNKFADTYSFASDSKSARLQALQRFCLDSAREGEFELYQALALGMTWLSLQPEINGQFFNIPVQVTNHSTALLLSPTYQALWVHSFNAGIELVIDIHTNQPSIFRPEHGRIYQKGSWHQQGRIIRYPFNHYFHETAHILLYGDLYARTVGESPTEDVSYFAHMEAVISSLEEVVFEELMAVRDDLNLIDDSYGKINGFEEAGEFRLRVFRGQVPGVTPHALRLYLKRFFQLGEGEVQIPDNPVKSLLLANHSLTDEELRLTEAPYARLIRNLQLHAEWGKVTCERNRIPAYREVIELMLPDAYCLQKLHESLYPETWSTPQALFSYQALPEPNTTLRQRNKQVWQWRETLCRLAETRGYLQQQRGEADSPLQHELLDIARHVATRIEALFLSDLPLAPDDHEQERARVLEDIRRALAQLSSGEGQATLWQFFDHPFTYLLEPR